MAVANLWLMLFIECSCHSMVVDVLLMISPGSLYTLFIGLLMLLLLSLVLVLVLVLALLLVVVVVVLVSLLFLLLL